MYMIEPPFRLLLVPLDVLETIESSNTESVKWLAGTEAGNGGSRAGGGGSTPTLGATRMKLSHSDLLRND